MLDFLARIKKYKNFNSRAITCMVEKRKRNTRLNRNESETKSSIEARKKVTVITKSVCAKFGNITYDVV